MELRSPKRQQRKACDVCRSRKVRCDILARPGSSCSVCEKAGIECQSTKEWAKPRRQRSGVQRRHLKDSDGSVITSSLQDNSTGQAANTQERQRVQHSETGDEAASPSLRPLWNRSANASTLPGGTLEPEREELARNGLANFYRHGVSAGDWSIFDATENFRIAYIGTPVSNLSHLVSLRRLLGHQRLPAYPTGGAQHLHSQGQGGPSPIINESGDTLHYPYPPITPNKPWKPSPQAWGLSHVQDLADDVSSLPAPEIRDALVNAFFEHVHPFLPVISKDEFMAAYRTPENPPPLILLQAVLMAGAHACSHPLVAKDRHTVKSILFRRASLLYHTRHETSRIFLMQAAILFTWHIGDGDTVTGGPWYWAGIALRISCGMGAHRHILTVPRSETSQFRRGWWSAFVCEVLSSLETGRPCAIRAEDVDQALLTEEDMTDNPTGISDDNVKPDFLNRMAELAYIGLDIISASSPRQTGFVDVNSVSARLGLWSLKTGICSLSDTEDPTACQLRIHYNLFLLHLHRNLPNDPDSLLVCSAAARAIVGSLEKLADLDCLSRCHFSSVGAVTAAGIQLAKEIRAASDSKSFLMVIHALEQLARLLRCTMKLSQFWPNAEAVHSVFHELHQEYEVYVSQDLQGDQLAYPDNQPDWDRLLSGAQVSHLNHISAEKDWLNMTDWSDLL